MGLGRNPEEGGMHPHPPQPHLVAAMSHGTVNSQFCRAPRAPKYSARPSYSIEVLRSMWSELPVEYQTSENAQYASLVIPVVLILKNIDNVSCRLPPRALRVLAGCKDSLALTGSPSTKRLDVCVSFDWAAASLGAPENPRPAMSGDD